MFQPSNRARDRERNKSWLGPCAATPCVARSPFKSPSLPISPVVTEFLTLGGQERTLSLILSRLGKEVDLPIEQLITVVQPICKATTELSGHDVINNLQASARLGDSRVLELKLTSRSVRSARLHTWTLFLRSSNVMWLYSTAHLLFSSSFHLQESVYIDMIYI